MANPEIPRRRPRPLRRHRRSGLSADLPRPAVDGAARPPRRPGHRRRAARPGRLDQLRARMRQSIADHGGVDDGRGRPAGAARLQYVAGEYHDAATFDRASRRRSAGAAAGVLPRHPDQPVRRGRDRPRAIGLRGQRPRLIVEKPFGRDLASARALNATLHESFPEAVRLSHRPLPRKGAGAEPALLPVRQHVPRAALEPRPTSSSCQITMAEAFGVRGRGRFYEEVGAIRDVFQNHLLQVLTLLAMDAPAGDDGAAIEAAKVALLAGGPSARTGRRRARAVPRVPLRSRTSRPDSRVETYVAARLAIDNRALARRAVLDPRGQVPGRDGDRSARPAEEAGGARCSTPAPTATRTSSASA